MRGTRPGCSGRRGRPPHRGPGSRAPSGPDGRPPAPRRPSRSPRVPCRIPRGRTRGPGALDRRPRPGCQRLGQRGLLVHGQRPGVVADLHGFPTQAARARASSTRAEAPDPGRRRQVAADRHRLPEGRQRLRFLADLVDQLAQLRVRLGQHRLRAGVGLALQQVAQPVVKPPGRAQQLVPQRPQPVLLQCSFLLDSRLERPDRLAGQLEPRLHPPVGLGERRVGRVLLPDRFAKVDDGPVQFVVLRHQRPVGPALHRQHRPETGQRHQHRRHHRRHQRPVPPRPPMGARTERLAPGRDRLVGRPPLDVLDQRPARRISILGPRRHRLEADRLERLVDPRVELPRRRELAAPDLGQHLERHPPRRAACRSGGSRASHRANRRRSGGRAGRGPRRPARGSCTPACPAPSRAASRPSRWPTRA